MDARRGSPDLALWAQAALSCLWLWVAGILATYGLATKIMELAKAIAELKSEEEKLAATQEELQKANAEIMRLRKSQ